MGLFGSDKNEPETAEALEESGVTAKTANALVGKLMDVGIDGLGPLDSVARVVEEALQDKGGHPEKAINKIVRSHIKMSAVGGFVTGVGGIFTLVVSLPANIIEFYVLATRMVGSIATIRGYDLERPEVRAAVLLTLVGADSQDLLSKAGVAGTGRLAQVAMQRLPKAAVMVINKGVGFRLATKMGAKSVSRFTRAVPVVGGGIGAGLDAFLMNRIADQARTEFPEMATAQLEA
ncbi:EcsC family protein [Ornithinimicrobium ciconiae]|uniref:EcsC family protein n=1 Tax=Ornithinimicrobium ciconiae TaxID=2594265 RepID=UPI001D17F992|nr:EcsC family protein [Ornithinimicrobium ciconiae]